MRTWGCFILVAGVIVSWGIVYLLAEALQAWWRR